jgi:pimeloyl-ACP methyl ester carboxylesterase
MPHRHKSRCLAVAKPHLIAALLPALLLLPSLVIPQSAPPPPGKLVNVGNHRIHFLCSGAGAPTVVVENGLGDFSTDWSLVQSRVEKFTRICTYDRAGYAWSEPGPFPRTFDQLNLELHEGLKALNERGPFILVGHSFGGPVIRHYVSLYPDEVAGMVLVDAPHEDQRIPMGPHAARIRDSATGRPLPTPHLEMELSEKSANPSPPAPPSAESPSAEPLDPPHLKLSKQNQRIDLWAGAQPSLAAAENSQKEWSSEYLAHQHATPQKGILGAIPLIVLTRTQGYTRDLDVPASQLEQERLSTQRLLAALSTNSLQILVPGGHQMHLESPDAVASAIQRVVLAVRAKSPLR